MGTVVWQGDAVTVAQESRATPANVGVADVFTLICGGVSVSYTAETGDGVAEVVAGLVVVWNASEAPMLTEITASDQTTYVKLLCNAEGVEFVVTATAVDGDASDTQTLTMSTPTAAAGPNVWAAANFDTGALPVNGDDVVIEKSDVDILYGLDQSAVTLDSLTIKKSYTGSIGLPRTVAAGGHVTSTATYVEYREMYLIIGATATDIGEGDGNGSPRLKLDNSSIAATVNVHNAGNSSDQTLGSVIWKGTNAANVFNHTKGEIDVAPFSGETAVIATLSMSTSAAVLRCGSGTTLTTISQSAGNLTVRSNVTTHTQTAGTFAICDAATLTTLNLYGGTCYYRSSGTMTTANVSGRLDFRQDPRARTVTNCEAYGGCAIHDPQKTVTWTNDIDLHMCGPMDTILDIGTNLRLGVGAVA